jgi:hypothetical protein
MLQRAFFAAEGTLALCRDISTAASGTFQFWFVVFAQLNRDDGLMAASLAFH